MEYNTVYVEEVLKETEQAILCSIDGDEIWLPLSQIEDPPCEGDTDVEIEVASWLCEEKGI